MLATVQIFVSLYAKAYRRWVQYNDKQSAENVRDMDAGNDDSNARKMCKPKGEEDWSALAGEQEVVLLKVMGFDITPIHNGQVLYDKGRANSYMAHYVFRRLLVVVSDPAPVCFCIQAGKYLHRRLEQHAGHKIRAGGNLVCYYRLSESG